MDFQSNTWLALLAIILPTLVPAVASFATVFWLFKLSTDKEKRDLDVRRQRALGVSPAIWLQLSQIIKDAEHVDGPLKFQDLETRIKGIAEYCEIATREVYEYNSINAFGRFATLKRIVLFSREEIIRLGLQTDNFTHPARSQTAAEALKILITSIELRMSAYANLYL